MGDYFDDDWKARRDRRHAVLNDVNARGSRSGYGSLADAMSAINNRGWDPNRPAGRYGTPGNSSADQRTENFGFPPPRR